MGRDTCPTTSFTLPPPSATRHAMPAKPWWCACVPACLAASAFYFMFSVCVLLLLPPCMCQTSFLPNTSNILHFISCLPATPSPLPPHPFLPQLAPPFLPTIASSLPFHLVLYYSQVCDTPVLPGLQFPKAHSPSPYLHVLPPERFQHKQRGALYAARTFAPRTRAMALAACTSTPAPDLTADSLHLSTSNIRHFGSSLYMS